MNDLKERINRNIHKGIVNNYLYQSARLVICKNGEKIFENLNIIIYPGDPDKRSKREACEKIRTKREYIPTAYVGSVVWGERRLIAFTSTLNAKVGHGTS